MLVLPNTPTTPVLAEFESKHFPHQLVASRSKLIGVFSQNYNDSIRYVVKLTSYLNDVTSYVKGQLDRITIDEFVEYTNNVVISSTIPWKGVKGSGKESKKRFKLKSAKLEVVQWSLLDEVVATLASVSLVYIKIAAELANELIDSEVNAENTEKWKQVVNFYKSAYSFGLFGQNIVNESSFNALTFNAICKTIDISIQMSILSKSSWINRDSYRNKETFETKNNGTLARVAIFIVDELKHLQSLVSLLITDITLDSTNWQEYLQIVEKYNIAYAGEFLSIEYYQQNKLGHALGLVGFSLLTLQTKNIGDANSKIARVMNRVQSRKNENALSKLESISSLKIEKTIFAEKSGIILNDISYLFDQLVHLHFKFTKENDNIAFDQVVNWKDINKDSKWPTGCHIPVRSVAPFDPFSQNENTPVEKSRREAYY